MFTQYGQAVADIQGKFEGGVSFDIDWYSLGAEGAREVRKTISPATIKRRVAIFGGLAQGLPIYTSPDDVHTPAGLYPALNSFDNRDYTYQAAQAYFQSQREDAYTIDYINAIPFIYANVGVGNVTTLLSASEVNTTLTGVQMVTNARNFIKKSVSLVGTFSDTDFTLDWDLSEAQNYSDYQRGVVLIPFNTVDVTQIEEIAFYLLSDDSNYFKVSSLSDVLGNQYTSGWNLARLDLSVRSSVGSPVISNITKCRVEIKMKSGQSQEVFIDDITLHQTNEAFFEYYSNNNFRDADGVWLPQATADTDEILFTDEAYDAWVYSVCELVVQNASYDAVDSRESTRITNRKLTAIEEHRRKFPSMQKPQSYNIASDVSL